MKLEDKLVSLRKSKGLSQLKLAELMNVSRQAVSRWETGSATPSADNLKYLSSLYEVSFDFLLNDDNAEDSHTEVIPEADITVTPPKKNARNGILMIGIVVIFIVAICGAFYLGSAQSNKKVISIEDLPAEKIDLDSGFEEFEITW